MKIAALVLLTAFALTACEDYDDRPVHRHPVYVGRRPYDDDYYYYAPRRRAYYDDGYYARPYYGRSRVIVY